MLVGFILLFLFRIFNTEEPLNFDRSTSLVITTWVGEDPWIETPDLGDCYEVLIVVKSFTQVERNIRDARNPFVYGRRNPRNLTTGMIFSTKLDSDKLSLTFYHNDFQYVVYQPLGVHFENTNTIMIATGDFVVYLDFENEEIRTVGNEWFSHLHTLDKTKDGSRILVTSSGVDYLMEIDSENHEVLWTWDPWEHGYEMNSNGVYFTRSKNTSEKFILEGKDMKWIHPTEEGATNTSRLATSDRPTHLNSGYYDRNSNIICSIPRMGKVLLIDGPRTDPKTERLFKVVVSGLGMPHGFHENFDDSLPFRYYGCNTTNGSVLFLDENFNVIERISFSKLPNVTQFRRRRNEWIQNIDYLGNGIFVVVDNHRSNFYLIQPGTKRYRIIQVASNWSPQQVVRINSKISKLIRSEFAKNISRASIKNELERQKLQKQKSDEERGDGLVDLQVKGLLREKRLNEMKNMSMVRLNVEQSYNLELIGIGAFSPKRGFQNEKDFLDALHLSSYGGPLYTIPFLLTVPLEIAENYEIDDEFGLLDYRGHAIIGALKVGEIFEISEKNREMICMNLYRYYFHRPEKIEPVTYFMEEMDDYAISGEIELFGRVNENPYAFTPKEIRKEIVSRGWKNAVAYRVDVEKLAKNPSLKYMLEIVENRYGNILLNHPSHDTSEQVFDVDVQEFETTMIVFTFFSRFRDYGSFKEMFHFTKMFRNYGANMIIIDERNLSSRIQRHMEFYIHRFNSIFGGDLRIPVLFFKDLFFCKVELNPYEISECKNLFFFEKDRRKAEKK